MSKITIDLKNKSGEIKPLHGVCCAPYRIGGGSDQNTIDKYFKEGGIPFCRLHDCGGVYGLGQFVDITNVFPDFSADENDPGSYNFYYTDEYVSEIEKSGCKTYYRLGETIEWGSRNYSTRVPEDFGKWARICEHIIMHYNEGWANGFEYGIEYWEIWNEPENPGSPHNGKCQWQGSKEEFFELYKIASKHLKQRFPNIKIGGYGSCGFYIVTKDDVPESFGEFVTFFTDFLEFAKKEKCPLDFFSWHIYSLEVEKIIVHAEYVRKTLDKYGFTETESHLNEWNIGQEGKGFEEKHDMRGASFNGAVFARLQACGLVDKAMYYCFSVGARYNGLMNPYHDATEPSWMPFVAFNKLYSLKNAVQTDTLGNIYAVAAENFGKAAILISSYKSEDEDVTLEINNIGGAKKAVFRLLDGAAELKEVMTLNVESKLNMTFKMKQNTVITVEIDDECAG